MDEKTVRQLITLAHEKIARINNGSLSLSFKKESIRKIRVDIEEYEEILSNEDNFKRKTVAAVVQVAKPAPVKKVQVREKFDSANRTVTEREMQREHDRYVSANIPEHLLDKLKNMPNNRGFVFRKIYLFGHLPLKKITNTNNLVMTERVGDKIMVHEFNSKNRSLDDMHERERTEYKYYEKPKWEPRPQRTPQQKDYRQMRGQNNPPGPNRGQKDTRPGQNNHQAQSSSRNNNPPGQASSGSRNNNPPGQASSSSRNNNPPARSNKNWTKNNKTK